MNQQHHSLQTEKTKLFIAKKSLGQNFLTSAVVPNWLADAGDVIEGDIIIEIGPGTGVLTKELLRRGAIVYAIETDSRAVTLLQDVFQTEIASQQLHLIEADMRQFDISSLNLRAGQYKVIANIPYYLSGFLLRLILEHPQHPQSLVFLMQKELVERIARAKKGSLLSLGVKVFGQPQYVKTVTRGHFKPSPKVDSAILKVIDITRHHLPTEQIRKNFFALLHLGFGQKRKQLQHNLAAIFTKEQISSAFSRAGLPYTIRAEDVTLVEWLILAAELKSEAVD